jgi:hypothetical protein
MVSPTLRLVEIYSAAAMECIDVEADLHDYLRKISILLSSLNPFLPLRHSRENTHHSRVKSFQ